MEFIDGYGIEEDIEAAETHAHVSDPSLVQHVEQASMADAASAVVIAEPLAVTMLPVASPALKCVRCKGQAGQIRATQDLVTWCVAHDSGVVVAISDMVCRGCIPTCPLCNDQAGLYAAEGDFVTSCADWGRIIAVKDLVCQTCIRSKFKTRKCCACGDTTFKRVSGAGSQVIAPDFLQQHADNINPVPGIDRVMNSICTQGVKNLTQQRLVAAASVPAAARSPAQVTVQLASARKALREQE